MMAVPAGNWSQDKCMVQDMLNNETEAVDNQIQPLQGKLLL